MREVRPVLAEPWYLIEDDDRLRTNLERQLRREVTAGHLLHGKCFRAIAKREDRDDVLYLLDGAWAIVHLVWSSGLSLDPRWPTTWTFPTLDDLQKRIAADVDEFNLVMPSSMPAARGDLPAVWDRDQLIERLDRGE